MISIFTMPKAFTGEFKTIQLNAIKTWKEECPSSEILLAANEEDVPAISNQLGVRCFHGVRESRFGSPLLNSLFQRAEEEAHGEIMAFINTDCMLVGNLEKAVNLIQTQFEKFLMVGIRYDSDISQFPSENWKEFVLRNKGLLHPLARKKMGKTSFGGTDLFIFPKGLYPVIPPFNIGTYFWDAWLIYDVWQRRIPIINITPDIIIIHQEHTTNIYRIENFQKKVDINRKLCPIKKDARDADFILENGVLRQGETSS